MRRFARLIGIGTAVVGIALAASGCTAHGLKGVADAATGPCAPVAGRQLVALTDDQHVEGANNLVPAVNAKAATPQLLAALNAASAVLTQDRLINLNKATDADRIAPKDAAQALAASAKLAQNVGSGPGGQITIGASDINESQSVAFLYQIALRAAGYNATVEPMGSRDLYLPALEKDEIQVMPEYLGTLTDYLNAKANGPSATPASSPDVGRTAVALTRLGQRFGLAFGKPAAAGNQNAFAVTRALADRYHVHTLSEFAAACKGGAVILGGPPGCATSAFCEPSLRNIYGIDIARFVPLDAGGPKTKQALTGGKISIGLVFSSDAALAG